MTAGCVVRSGLDGEKSSSENPNLISTQSDVLQLLQFFEIVAFMSQNGLSFHKYAAIYIFTVHH